ncbi:MAG: chemotaxis protein CheA [Nitrospirota bacterium]|nr:MAG: chemotaxis protein CheA [Nitrospirota bacterium]
MSTSKNEFISEAEDLLGSAQDLTLEIQESIESGKLNPDSVNALFRDMHTLKGLSGLFGLQGITELSHKLESLLDDLRLGKMGATGDLCDFLLHNIDALRGLVKDDKGESVEDVAEHLNKIDEFTKGSGAKESELDLSGMIDDSVLSVLSEYEEHRLKANIKDGSNIYSVRVVFSLDDFDIRLSELTEKIKSSGELLSTLPTSDDVPAGHIGFNLIIGSSMFAQDLQDELGEELDTLVSASGRSESEKTPEVPARSDQIPEKRMEGPSASIKSISSTVRVDIDKLDGILNTIGELNLAKGAVRRIGQELFEGYGYKPLIVDTYKVAQSLERWVSALQDQVLNIRMIPIGQIFSRLAQIIRRYSRQSGKKINLNLFGEDTNIDKFLAEEAVDPLMHIVRNAIDHGIENEEERIKRGKDPEGTIILKAYQRGNHVVVDVIDDGNGIDVAKVKSKAIEKGLVALSDDYSNREIMEMIFLPGFSTAESVTEVSGRGVGMDIVKDRISNLGGFVTVESELGMGTTMSVTLPITLAILKALMVRVGAERFAIPLTSITESFEVTDEMIQTIEGRMVVDLRGELLPIVNVGDVFDIEHDVEGSKYVVVVGFAERKMGFLLDELFGQHEIVIKSLGDYFKGLKGFAGATEIGKHEIVLVVDVEAIIEHVLIKKRERLTV